MPCPNNNKTTKGQRSVSDHVIDFVSAILATIGFIVLATTQVDPTQPVFIHVGCGLAIGMAIGRLLCHVFK